MTQRKLSSSQVAALLTDYANGWTPHELTIIYKVSIRTVYRTLAEFKAKKPSNRSRNGKRKKLKEKPPLKPCGTNAAYARHKKNNEYPCTACLEAHALDVKIAKNRKKSA